MFADDVLIFTSNPGRDMPKLIETLDYFKTIAGLKINYSKCEILPLRTSGCRMWTTDALFTIARNKIKYLGISIGKRSETLYNLNFTPLIDRMNKELEMWEPLPLSLLGRMHLFRMASFSKLLYPLQTIPLLLTGLTLRG